MSGNARWPAWLGLALLVAGLANGIGPYLRRTGLIETARYEAFWDLHTGPGGFSRAPLGLGRRCVTHRRVEDGGAPAGPNGGPPARYALEMRGWEVPGKALKEVLVLALVAGSLFAWRKGWSSPVPLAQAWPLAALAVLVVWQAAAGLARGEPLMALAGLRAFGFLGIALTAGWVSREVLGRLVPWLVALLAVQAFLAPLELLRGIPVQGHGIIWEEFFARRAAGTFVMPNTLGVFAACVVALAAGFGATTRVRAVAWGLGGIVVIASGSATGLLVLLVVGIWELVGRTVRGPRRLGVVATGGVLLAAAVAYLPALMFRWDVYDSGHARLAALGATLRAPAASLLFGKGIGVGTIGSYRLKGGLENGVPMRGGGESAVSAVIEQTGLAGLALAGIAIVLTGVRFRSARPLLVALALASFTHNVTEAYPVGLLLGLILSGGTGSGLPSTLCDGATGRRTQA